MGAVELAELVERVDRGDLLSLHVACPGIGDAICALYAACGAANALRRQQPEAVVRFFTKHAGWLRRTRHPGVEVHPTGLAPDAAWIDVSRDYNGHLARATSRKQWYCDNIAPGLTPSPPAFVDRRVYSRRFDHTPYVVLAPFADWPSRHWPVSHWRYLTALLHDAGFHSVILDGPGDGSRLRQAFEDLPTEWSTWFWGCSEEWVADALLEAAAFVGIDSGMTHYAALLGVPTIAIMAHLPPDLVFSHTAVRAVTPQTSCTFCRWDPERGYRNICDAACSALATVAPEQVLACVCKAAPGVQIPAS